MVKALSFKGDPKKPKKRKRAVQEEDEPAGSSSIAADAAPADEQNWVSADAVTDITGPIIVVLPTQPVTCLACDANGKVFASKIENMVEDEPNTAEPHDTRQVWIANRIAGTESLSFKSGHNQKYLGCDKFGILGATTEAVSPEEQFTILPSAEGSGIGAQFCLQTTMRSKYITISDSNADTAATEIRGDGESASPETTFRIRMQAKYKPKLKAEKVEKAREKVTRLQLETEVGRRLDDDEVKKLKRARKEGTYHEALLDVKVKGKHDKFA